MENDWLVGMTQQSYKRTIVVISKRIIADKADIWVQAGVARFIAESYNKPLETVVDDILVLIKKGN